MANEGYFGTDNMDDLLDTSNDPDVKIVDENEHEEDDHSGGRYQGEFGDDLFEGKEDQNQEKDHESLIEERLKAQGYDPRAIKFENENGEIESYDFNDLTREEQLQLIEGIEDEESSEQWTDTEIETINFLRENNMTLQDLVKTIKDRTIAELSEKTERVYTVDEFSDDELFVADLRNKYGEDTFTEEELIHELEKAKENGELYNKKISKMRDEYKQYEIDNEEFQRNQSALEAEQARNEYIQKTVDAVRDINDLHDTVELEYEDKNAILGFMFDQDALGNTAFDQALLDPLTKYKAAWYIQNGDQVFSELHKYYQEEIAKLQAAIPKTKKPDTVIKPKNTQHTTQRKITKLEDLH